MQERIREAVGHLATHWPALSGVALCVMLTERRTWTRTLGQVLAGVLVSVVGTGPVLDTMGWDPEVYESACRGVLGLVGWQVCVVIQQVDEDVLRRVLRAWRGSEAKPRDRDGEG